MDDRDVESADLGAVADYRASRGSWSLRTLWHRLRRSRPLGPAGRQAPAAGPGSLPGATPARAQEHPEQPDRARKTS